MNNIQGNYCTRHSKPKVIKLISPLFIITLANPISEQFSQRTLTNFIMRLLSLKIGIARRGVAGYCIKGMVLFRMLKREEN